MTVAFPIIASLASLGYAAYCIRSLKLFGLGNEKIVDIQRAIREGSVAYIKRQYKSVVLVALVSAAFIWMFFDFTTALGFVIGAVGSGFAGYVGMMTAADANAKTAEAARLGLSRAFTIAFAGGSVTGFLIVGIALFVVTVFYAAFGSLTALIGLGFGGSLISIFARLGGGIFAKGADVGADSFGKIDAGVPEDDPRNLAVVVGTVGDNVSHIAGMAADIFETYVVTVIAAMLLGSSLFPENPAAMYVSLVINALAAGASMIGCFFVTVRDDSSKITTALYRGLAAAGIVLALALLPAVSFFFEESVDAGKAYGAVLVGLLVTALLILATAYSSSKNRRPVQSVAQASTAGHAANIVMGLSVSMEATVFPAFVICFGILSAYWFFGIFGVALAALSMVSLAGMVVAIEAFGSIAGTAGGIAGVAGLPDNARKIIGSLDAAGNTVRAVTKGYAIGSAGLAGLVLFASYAHDLELFGLNVSFELTDPFVIGGLLLGALMPYLVVSMAMKAVGRAGKPVAEEVRRQFRENKGMTEGISKPDYVRTVDVATRAAIREMIIPALIPVLFPIIIFFVFGSHRAETIGGLLMGSIVSGFFAALAMVSGGALWNNAKKFIEEGNYGGESSLAHQAAVTGDAVGDLYTETAGPAINPMIKIVNIVALLLARLF